MAAGPVVLMGFVVLAVPETKMVKAVNEAPDASADLVTKAVKAGRAKVAKVAKAKDGPNVLLRTCEREPARAATEMSPLLALNTKTTSHSPILSQ
jgi:hypothetical protein